MAISIRLTDQVLRLDAKTTQPIWRALDVGAFDQLDISLFVPAIEGGSPSFALNLIGGMEEEASEGWVTVATFDTVTAGGTFQKRTIFGPPRFLCWSVDSQSGSVSFDLYGMAREKRMWSWPGQLPGLVLWLDAASIGGISDGGAIQTWSDKSPAANHAKQATGASQPVYRAAGPNGYGSVEFDGTDDWLATDTGDALGDFHVFVVSRTVRPRRATSACSTRTSRPGSFWVAMGPRPTGGAEASLKRVRRSASLERSPMAA